MNMVIFYYTGTGNSLWVARTIGKESGTSELICMPEFNGDLSLITNNTIGLVFPVYIWGAPAPVLRFIASLEGSKPDYIFAVAVNGGQVANTLIQLKKELWQRNLILSSGFEIRMPSNYIPWGGPGPVEKQQERFNAAKSKIATTIAPAIKAKQTLTPEKGPLWQRLVFSMFYAMSFSQVPKMDRSFTVDEKCNQCGVCEKVCPAKNISIVDGKPVWNHTCEQCFACLQWCPQKAIQCGKKTPGYERYHHPEVVLKDVLKRR